MSALPRKDLRDSRTPLGHAEGSAAALADAVRSETRLLAELLKIMRAQRDALAKDDLKGIEDCVFATHRVLMTLGEARRRRRAINHVLGEGDDLSVSALGDFFGGVAPAELRTAADEIAAAARELQREVSVNRRALRHAIEGADQFVQRLCGTQPQQSGIYPAAVRTTGGGAILDRRI